VMQTIQNIERKLGSEGRVLVRFSGTEPKARILVEGPRAEENEAFAQEIGEVLTRALA